MLHAHTTLPQAQGLNTVPDPAPPVALAAMRTTLHASRFMLCGTMMQCAVLPGTAWLARIHVHSEHRPAPPRPAPQRSAAQHPASLTLSAGSERSVPWCQAF